MPLPPHALGHQVGEPTLAAPEPLGPARVPTLGAFGPKGKADQDTGHGRQKGSGQNSYLFIRFFEVVNPYGLTDVTVYYLKKHCGQFGRTKQGFWFERGLIL